MDQLKNKVAVITGGTSGIGKATAVDFIKNGAVVILTGRIQGSVDQTVSELGKQARGIVSDAGKMSDLMSLSQKVQAISPKIDILYVNAGFGKYAPIQDISEEHFDEQFNVLVKGTLFTVQQMLPLMKEGGSIILNTSVVTEIGMPNSSVYSAAKAAVQSLVKTFASELAAKKIRINAVSPGPIETNYFDRSNLSPEQIKNTVAYVIPQVPLARFGQPEEVAKAVTFLASDGASFIHGTEISVDGGFPRIK
ncbi:NAD(P)-dependent dehydrogenase (short-subunit alcohol dehydrogenase family) [Chitinophaga niastensis]|uniref:NAD(P)-dependent dehydrogenase (Short-subunit alcohol dehydrogenase family) n=1 Tax=Chitinophaga niastensis TaxID=536980 RepID=A0A2P8HJ90_CHINA|nr:SDR family oxidoreductase [Chitinophaga niastensis]PSL46278.1 NAD(P)-dependent dehydrogenase (short-subunit alcohol dehydrogenase family) [Chitinophaga niastensis]